MEGTIETRWLSNGICGEPKFICRTQTLQLGFDRSDVPMGDVRERVVVTQTVRRGFNGDCGGG